MSNFNYNIKHVLGRYRNKLSLNDDTILRVPLQSKTSLTQPDNNNFVVNLTEQFTEERNNSDCYRINGKLEIITDNALKAAWTDYPTSDDWSPEPVIGNPISNGELIGKNWVLQITYPFESNYEFEIKSKDLSGGLNVTKASEGMQVESITPIEIKNGKLQVLVRTIQKHDISEIGEYIYIKPLQGELSYLGFHRVIDFEPNNEDNGLILETSYVNVTQSFKANIKKVFEPSFNDTVFNNFSNIDQIQACDADGLIVGPLEYTKLFHENHGLLIGDFVDIRLSNFSGLNGLWKVEGIPTPNEFIIKYQIPGANGGIITISNIPSNNGVLTLKYKFIDGVPSEYYVRKFKVLSNLTDYEVYKAGYSTNIFADEYSNDVFLFHFNKDISVNGIRDNIGRPISELYLTISKRSSSGHPDYDGFKAFSDVISLFEDSKFIQPNPVGSGFGPYKVEDISYWQNNNPNSSGSIEKPLIGDWHYGDFVSYNRAFLEETVISKTIHRFAPSIFTTNNQYTGQYTTDINGYYYYPHNKITIREFSDVINTVKNLPDEEYPDYAQINNDGTLSWRNVLGIGSFEPGTNKGVDHTFINGCNYLFGLYPIYIRKQLPVRIIDLNLDKSKYIKTSNNIGLVC